MPSKKTDEIVEVECVAGNVWTSNGKLTKGEKDIVPADEAKSLGKAVKVLK